MATGLTEESFARLLDHLDADRGRAAERYEDLRRTLVRLFEWRGAPFPEEHADETFDRVARRLAEGVSVRNVGGYCYTVARMILLETHKSHDSRLARIRQTGVDTVAAAADTVAEEAEKEARLACLDECLDRLPADSRELIVEYYRDGPGGRVGARRSLAQRLGLRNEALTNRAQRLRDKLERCVSSCLERRPST